MRMLTTSAVALVALAGCSADLDATGADAQVLPASQAGLPQPMTLDITDPLVPGSAVDITITGAVPGSNITVVRSNGSIGAGGCPPFLAGDCVDITPGTSGYQPLPMSFTADGMGTASWSGTLPATVPVGASFVFQAVNVADVEGSTPIARTVAASACADDALEDNDTPGTATASPATPLTATACDADDDFFTFVVPDGEVGTIEVAFDHATDGDIDLRLTDSSGTFLASSTSTSDIESVEYFNDTGADVIVAAEVYLFADNGGTPDGADYDLTYSTTVPAPCVADGYEPNDDSATAFFFDPAVDTISAATSCAADADWYTFDALTGDAITLAESSTFAEGNLEMTLYDATLTLVDSSTFGSITHSALTDGPYFVEIVQLSDAVVGGGVPYDLTADVATPTVCADDIYEPNDDAFTTATGLTMPVFEAGLTSCVADEIDWFTVDLTAGDDILATAYHSAAEGDIDVYLFDAPQANDLTTLNGNYLARAYTGSDDDSFTYTVPTTGTYYVAVRLWGDGGLAIADGNAYDLEIVAQ